MVHCHKCGKSNKEEAKFCVGCGGILKSEAKSHSKEHPEKEKTHRESQETKSSEKKSKHGRKDEAEEKGWWNNYKVSIPVVIALIVIGFVIFVVVLEGAGRSSSSGSQAGSPARNCQSEQVPYETQEAYTEREPYQTVECNQEALRYSKEVTSCKNSLLIFGNARTECTVSNLDYEYGLFEVAVEIKCEDGQRSRASKILPIPARSAEIYKHADLSTCTVSQCTCDVDPPTKRVCEEVTKYRDVTRYRTVTKYKTEQVCN